MSHREKLLREIARYPLAQRDIQEVDEKIKKLDAELDAAVEQHQRDCGPVQAELRAIEESQIGDIVDRKPLDAERETRRKGLLYQIEQANVALENIRDDVDRRRKILLAERKKVVANLPAVDLIRTELFRQGDPSKQERYAVLEAAERLVDQRILFEMNRKIESLEINLHNLKGRGDSDPAAEKLLERQRAIHSVIGDAAARMSDERKQLYQELISE